jgi:hypothetical protein
MAGTVQVTFGANIQPLIDGIDKVRTSVNSIGSSLTHLAEAFGIAFSAEGIKSFVESMAQLGLNTERTEATLGLSNDEVVQLSGFAKLTGTDVDSLSTGIERMSLQIQKSTRDGINPQAQALKVLGLNARELIGLPADQWFLKLAAAVGRFNPSLNLTNAVMAVGGRGIADMMPALLRGAEGFQRLTQEVQKASEGLAQAVPGMADTHEKLTLLGVAAQSLGARIFTAVKPAIDAVVVSVTNWVESFHGDEIRDNLNDIGNATIEVGRNVSLFAIEVGASFAQLKDNLGYILGAAAAIAVATKQWQIAAALAAPAMLDLAKYFHSGSDQITKDADAAKAHINAIADAAKAAFNAQVPHSGTGAAMAADLIAISQAAQESMLAMTRQNATAINENGAQMVAAMQSHYQEMIKRVDDFYALRKEQLAGEVAQYKITYGQETAALLQELDARQAGEDAAYDAEIAALKAAGKNYEAVVKQKTAADDKWRLDHDKIVQDSLKHEAAQWQSMLGTVESEFNSQLRGLLAGTTTWQQAWRKMLGDMIIRFIEMCETLAVKWAATELAKTTATVAGTSVREGAESAASSAGMLAMIGNAIKAIVADAGQTFAGVFAFLAPTMGPAAAGPAAASSAAVLGAVPSLAVGGYVERGGLALIHANETIVPARASSPYAGGGGVTRSDLRGLLADHRDQMGQMMALHRGVMSGLEGEIYNLRRKLR